jgi:hypothetical protein
MRSGAREWPLAARSSSKRAETQQKIDAGFVRQGRLLLAQGAEPGEQMGIAAELAEAAQARESSAEIRQEASRDAAIAADGVGAQRQSESSDVSFEDLFEAVRGERHQFSAESNKVRFAMAWRYSRQTSWGARWT